MRSSVVYQTARDKLRRMIKQTKREPKPDHEKPRSRGFFYAVTAAILFALTPLFIKILNTTFGLPALMITFWRNILGIALLLPAFLIFKPALLKLEKKHFGFIALYGLVFTLLNTIWTFSIQYNSASVATVLIYFSAPMTSFLGWWMLKERFTWLKGLAILLGLGGCALVALAGAEVETNWIGLVLGLVSGLIYAFYAIFGRLSAQRGINPWTSTFYIFFFAMAALFILNLLPFSVPGQAQDLKTLLTFSTNPKAWLFMGLLTVPLVVGYGLFNQSLTILPSSTANLILTLEPPITAILAWLMLSEKLLPLQLLGTVLVLSGVFLVRIGVNNQSELSEHPAKELV